MLRTAVSQTSMGRFMRSSGHQFISSWFNSIWIPFCETLSLSPAVARLPSGPIQRDILGRRSIIWASPSLTQHLSIRTTHALRQWDFGPSNGNSVNGGQSSDAKNTAVTYHFHAFRLCFLLMLKPCFSHLFGVRLWGVLAARDEVGVALSQQFLWLSSCLFSSPAGPPLGNWLWKTRSHGVLWTRSR